MNLINDLHNEFLQGSLERGKFEGLIYRYYLKNRNKTACRQWKNEDYEDFLSWFYPRLKNSIDSYRQTGSTYEAFLNTIMQKSAKEYRNRNIINNLTEYSAWSVYNPETYACEESPIYTCEKQEEDMSVFLTANTWRKSPKQFLALVLKCYYYVSDDFLEKIYPYTGVDYKKLKEMITELRVIRTKKEQLIYKMRENLYSRFYRCMVYEKRLLFLQEDTVSYTQLKEKIGESRQKLEKIKRRLAMMRTDATNREVAQVIGSSKSSVDVSLYNLKNKWELSQLAVSEKLETCSDTFLI